MNLRKQRRKRFDAMIKRIKLGREVLSGSSSEYFRLDKRRIKRFMPWLR